MVKIDAERVDDSDLVQATLAGAGIKRVEKDLTILIKRYGTGETEPVPGYAFARLIRLRPRVLLLEAEIRTSGRAGRPW